MRRSCPYSAPRTGQIIESYYNLLLGTLAPGSVNRSAFPWCRERVGSELSRADAVEKDLQPLPRSIELQLSQITGDYARYTLGRHVLLVRKSDLAIGDIIKNVAVTLK